MDDMKVSEVINRTGVDATTAQAALETAGGDVDIAVRIIRAYHLKDDDATTENQTNPSGSKKEDSQEEEVPFAQDIFAAIEKIWRQGNASHLEVAKDGRQILSLSLTVSAIGLILAPVAALIGLGAAWITDYKITITLENGTVIDVNEFALHEKQNQDPADR